MSKEKILNAIHIKWLSKAKTAVINGEEMTVLPYGYLTQACSEVIDQTREETIDFDEELLEIGIQRILEPYFVVLDGRDNEPANETVIEISRIIISKIKQSLKSLINK